MNKVFITGSSAGLGYHASVRLIELGHEVVLHVRNEKIADQLKSKLPTQHGLVIGDITTLSGMKAVAEAANDYGPFDAIIHNAALGISQNRVLTADGMTEIFAVNVAAPYVLTALIEKPKRLVYLSSESQATGDEDLSDLQWESKPWRSYQAYCDTKLFDLMISMYMTRYWSDVHVNALDPGWIPTKLGGRGAPGNFDDGTETQIWLAVSEDAKAKTSGKYFFHKRSESYHSAADNHSLQNQLIDHLRKLTHVTLP